MLFYFRSVSVYKNPNQSTLNSQGNREHRVDWNIEVDETLFKRYFPLE